MMEQQEGMTLSMHLDEDDDMEEEIEWYTPIGEHSFPHFLIYCSTD